LIWEKSCVLNLHIIQLSSCKFHANQLGDNNKITESYSTGKF